MFTDNGVDVNAQELLQIFNIVDEDSSGALTLDEFQVYAVDKNAQEKFRHVIKAVRQRLDMEYFNK